MMKFLVLFVLFFLIGCFGMLFYLHYTTTIPSPKKVTTAFSLEKAPSKSLQASFVSFSGDIEWTSRVATAPAKLTNVKNFQQGEEIDTGKNSTAVVHVEDTTMSLSQNTKLSFIQMLPTQIVVSELDGTIQYEKKSSLPFSVRVGDVLMSLNTGSMTISADSTKNRAVLTLKNGNATVAYTDETNVSQVLTAKAGQQVVYDGDSQTAIVN